LRTLNQKIVSAIFVISFLALFFFHQTLDYNDKSPGTEITIAIPNGATGSQMAQILANSKVVKSQKYFIQYYVTNPESRGIAPGLHRVQQHISTKLAVSQLLDQKRIQNSVEVKEGSTLSDVKSLLRANHNIVSAADSPPKFAIPITNPKNSLEGQLAPAIYSFAPGTTLNSALQQMLDKFQENISALDLKSRNGLSNYQILTLASIIQVEGDVSDFKKVARVIYNRLAIHMPLQLNSTVQYAAGLRGRIALSTKATTINSPYNTYRNIGLPPTPIANPSNLAIAAALNPEAGDWLYFITVKPGDTRFTKDFNEFQKWNTLYNDNLANGLFK
jgi:UPF0755 protein